MKLSAQKILSTLRKNLTTTEIDHPANDELQSDYQFHTKVMAHMKDSVSTMQMVRKFLADDESVPKLPLHVYAALMLYWHDAYHQSMSNVANPDYVKSLLSATSKLLEIARTYELLEVPKMQNIGTDVEFYRSRLELRDDETLSEGIERIKLAFEKNPSTNWAEMLLRPMAGLSNSILKFPPDMIRLIFNKDVLRMLLPLTVTGSKTGINTDIVPPEKMSFLPPEERFAVGDLKFTISPQLLCLVVEGSHHCNVFGAEFVLGINVGHTYKLFEKDNAFQFGNGKYEVFFYEGKVVMQSNGYRLHLSKAEFDEIVTNVASTLAKDNWQWFAALHKSMRGDH